MCKPRILLIVLFTSFCMQRIFAQPAPAAAPAPKFTLTVYSSADPASFNPQDYAEAAEQGARPMLPGYAVVREIRKIDLAAGDNVVKFSDVAAGIDPTTVSFKSLTAPDSTAVLEQNFEFDLVSPDKLLQKYLDKDVIINRRVGAQDKGASAVETTEGTLLSYDGQQFVLQTDNRQLPVQIIPRDSVSEVKLFDLQTGLITKPTLVWKIAAEKAGAHDAQVTYQTSRITWRADYNITVNKDDTAADIGAWVTLMNQTGASYPEAKLKLVAGDVQRIQPPQPMAYGGIRMAMTRPRGATFEEKPLFEYHMYTLDRLTSLSNNSTKQLELFPTKSGVPVTKSFVYYGLPGDQRYSVFPNPNTDRALGQQSNKSVDTYLILQNDQKSGMGIPLPAGRVRAYKNDEADGLAEFIGEDIIQHTPKDEQIMIRLGSAFDIVGERKQTDFTSHDEERWMTESFEIKLRNHRKDAAHILIKENLLRWFNWQIIKSSDKFDKVDYRTIQFPVDVPADGEKTVTYTVKYSW